MRRSTIYIVLILLLMAACKGRKRDMLIGTWHAVKLENPDMDSFFKNSQAYIDTVGKGHDSATNMELYGVANMDSMRKFLQQQFDSTKAMQMDAVAHTVFKFRKDSIVELSFNGGMDSSRWYLDKDGALILNDLNAQSAEDKARMEIVELTADVLKLRFRENNASSVVTFHPEGK
jgi:hypothetical protein